MKSPQGDAVRRLFSFIAFHPVDAQSVLSRRVFWDEVFLFVNTFDMWDLRFSRRRVWSLESSGMQRGVATLKLTDVSEVRTASIIRTIHLSVNFNVTTRRYIPEDSKRHTLLCGVHNKIWRQIILMFIDLVWSYFVWSSILNLKSAFGRFLHSLFFSCVRCWIVMSLLAETPVRSSYLHAAPNSYETNSRSNWLLAQ
jgi:hypothetical protein